MKKYQFFLSLLLIFSGQGFSQALPDPAFNSTIRQVNGGWIAGDATFSIALPGSKTLWLFGDSFIGTVNSDNSVASGAKMIRNCAILQDGNSMTALFGGTFPSPKSFFPSVDENSSWFWPEHGIVENDTLKIFFSEFTLVNSPSGFSFKYTAAFMARFTFPNIALVDSRKLPYYEFNGVCYGNSILVDNGYTYIFGRQETDMVFHISYPHIARVPVGNIMAPWEFFNGSSWSSDPAQTQQISSESVSQQFGVLKWNNKFVVINQEIWNSSRIYSFTSDFIEGPWNKKTLIYDTPILFANTYTYGAFPHPQFTADGKLLISYNSNGNSADIFKNVEVYRPRFIRVPFTMINPTYSSTIENPKSMNNEESVIVNQNYPNPAKDETKVKFTVVKRSYVSLQLNSIEGKAIQTYVNKILDPGEYDLNIELGGFKCGIYSYRINNHEFKLIKN